MSQSHIIVIPQDQLFLHVGGKTTGPFVMGKIREMFSEGEIDRATPLWFAGLDNWIAVGDIPEFDRRMRSRESSPRFPARANDVIIALKGKPVPLAITTVKYLIEHQEFRRADLVFSGKEDVWLRADQHPLTRAYFPSPAPPAVPPQD